LLAAGVLARVGGVALSGEADAIGVRELLTASPEELGVAAVSLAVARRVKLVVSAAFARLDPDHSGASAGITWMADLEHGFGDGCEVLTVFSAGDAPAIRLEPIGRRALYDGGVGELVDPVVIPVHEIDEVLEPEAPSGVLHLMVCPCGVPAFALHGEDLHVACASVLQGDRFTEGGRSAVPGGASVELKEEGLPLHLSVTREATIVSESEEVLERELPLVSVGDEIFLIAGLLIAKAERLVVDGEHRVDRRIAVSGNEDEAISEGELWAPNVPAHTGSQGRGDEQRHLGARATWVPALTQIQHHVDALIDQIPGLLPVAEVGRESFKGRFFQGPHIVVAVRFEGSVSAE
jgi:hypothetical protein